MPAQNRSETVKRAIFVLHRRRYLPSMNPRLHSTGIRKLFLLLMMGFLMLPCSLKRTVKSYLQVPVGTATQVAKQQHLPVCASLENHTTNKHEVKAVQQYHSKEALATSSHAVDTGATSYPIRPKAYKHGLPLFLLHEQYLI